MSIPDIQDFPLGPLSLPLQLGTKLHPVLLCVCQREGTGFQIAKQVEHLLADLGSRIRSVTTGGRTIAVLIVTLLTVLLLIAWTCTILSITSLHTSDLKLVCAKHLLSEVCTFWETSLDLQQRG